ncbi:glutamate-5-semialdehyde dehydrogenase [Aliarcobacter butzleri]|uniref:glutamate-5-semialdehyde dehydrogenase n=1 Tax=Aliarcobacter butzleri TaxID=28197 RepID=UPI001EDA9B84|nr:glutamate-5-semialdehyde dehydrogenase [Aliarcobacter butzleri]MCG3678963.1 glutamate-5-semialdehyde dehydrogenase [Aliarcobacter butzleri]MCG3704279.1 glutamate-5-semialdehyde dehydrogenase [Aliarcobacter butzleri]MCT7582302.1 glutamate-5-semialdehyde dehydrogenase [Aliarcobacter butzleri]MCT7603857.1 glutamate-5-semialdehyde dehydrogenase [Aliarcobacter butzleri]MCT7648965.1 glutamate-5-semialdehyde dehydrogenase [Aliarcobacter butzleri]
MQEFLQEAKNSSRIIANLGSAQKNRVLNEMADALIEHSSFILSHNQKDMNDAKLNNLNDALQDRLLLTEKRIQDMAIAIRQIASQQDPLGKILNGWVTKDGLNIQKVSIPIGVIGIIYESRPNVTSDTAALCFKSGNVCVLKGGKEAENSNKAIATILREVLRKNNLPEYAISLLPDSSREGVAKLIKQDKYVDLIVPRGGEALIRFVSENSSIPVIKHDKGICHIFIDQDANITKIFDIVVNAKCQKPSACNSIETLLIHTNIAALILSGLVETLSLHGTILKGCPETLQHIKAIPATLEDFDTEYLANVLNIKIVANVDEAITHIQRHGSGHSESILSENYTTINKFLSEVDAACVYANASTRFTDGGEFGLGAEVGISTNKLHSRGPMGIEDLTTFKYKIYGQGQIRKG